MKIAKATEADIKAALDLYSALDALSCPWIPNFPQTVSEEGDYSDPEPFDADNPEHCHRAMHIIFDIMCRGNLARFFFGATTMFDPANRCIDPDADTIELHPLAAAAFASQVARPLSDWHEDMRDVLWWKFPVNEAPWCGTPYDSDWPDYHTHWTPLPACPRDPMDASAPQEESCR